jgi:hypothetical protein
MRALGCWECGRPVEECSSMGEVYVGTWPKNSCMFQVTIRILRKAMRVLVSGKRTKACSDQWTSERRESSVEGEVESV